MGEAQESSPIVRGEMQAVAEAATLKVEPCDRSIFGFNLNACATKTGRFTVLGVMVYSTVMLGVKLKYVVFFWLGSWAKILCLVIKKKSLGDE
jgi:hypothetical protein